MIIFDADTKMFNLKTKNTSYIIKLFGDYIIEHVYWGKRLESLEGVTGEIVAEGAGMAANNYEYEGFCDGDVSTEIFPQDYSYFGSCDMRKPAFHAQYKDGSRITKMKYVSHKIYAGKPKLEGLPATYTENDSEADTLEIIAKDDYTDLEILYRYTAFNDYDAICRNVEVINRGDNDVNLKSVLSMSIDFKRDDFDMITLSGAWARERNLYRRPLKPGTTKIESSRGSSSHHQSPFFALLDKNTNENQGDVYGFSFVYSGNFEAGAQVDTFGFTRAFMGINSFDFNWKLEKDEKFVSPEVVMVYSSNGLGDMSRTYNKLYQKRLARGKYRDIERPILINNWEGTFFDFDEEKIVNIAKCAKKAGVELMVLDDGWFGKRNSETCSLGDWYVNTDKLPNGLGGLADKINALDMKFGLWFEPEMISPNSDLYEKHPDWCLHTQGRGRSEGRHQLTLDLSRDDVVEYIITFLTNTLKSANIEYVKWDMNRTMTCAGSAFLSADRQPEIFHRYMLGLYKILETMVTEFPNILFEGCAGGGGRFDAGQMYYFNQYWTSDNTDAVDRMYIQYSTSLVMPSAFMGAHVSKGPNYLTQRHISLKTRGLVAMGGQLGYELDLTKASDEEIAEMAEQIELYKGIRNVVHNGDLYRLLSPYETDKASWMYVSCDKKHAVLFYFVIHGVVGHRSVRLKLEGLDENKTYKLKSTGEVYSGAVLMNYGITVTLDNQVFDTRSELFVLDEI